MLPGVYSIVSSIKYLERYGSGSGYLGKWCHFLFILWSEWVMTPCGLVGGYQCCRGTYWFIFSVYCLKMVVPTYPEDNILW